MQINSEDIAVIHNKAEKRFQIRIDNHLAELLYQLSDGTITFIHTSVPSALEGQGIGSKLAKAGLDFAQVNSLKVRSLCWFVDRYIQRHPEYQSLLR